MEGRDYMNSYQAGYEAGYWIGISLSIGILLGLLPFFIGRKMGSSLLGTIGLVGCIVSSFFHPASAVLTAIVFVAVILIKNR